MKEIKLIPDFALKEISSPVAQVSERVYDNRTNRTDDASIFNFEAANTVQYKDAELKDTGRVVSEDDKTRLSGLLFGEDKGDGETVLIRMGDRQPQGYDESRIVVFEANNTGDEQDDRTVENGQTFASVLLPELTFVNDDGKTVTLADAYEENPKQYEPYANFAVAGWLLENGAIDEIVEDGDYLGLVNTTGLDLTLDLPDKFAIVEPNQVATSVSTPNYCPPPTNSGR